MDQVAALILLGVFLIGFNMSVRRSKKVELPPKTIRYPRPIKVLVTWLWLFSVSGIVYIGINGDTLTTVFCGIFFLILLMQLHLEAHLVKVTWDSQHIHTKSPWRKSRTIPIKSVEMCDFSKPMQWYRIYTSEHGIVRLHVYTEGVSELLAELPVKLSNN